MKLALFFLYGTGTLSMGSLGTMFFLMPTGDDVLTTLAFLAALAFFGLFAVIFLTLRAPATTR